VSTFGRLAAGAILLATVTGCHRHESSGEGSPAPSSSVISLGMELGTCPDLEACARECDAGSADRCRRLAMSYSFGKGVDRDEARAAALLEKSCAMGDPSSCLFAGQMYEFEHGVSKDDARAAKYYELSCLMKWVAGCYNLGLMYERGRGVPADRAKALDLYRQSCDGGSKIACEKVKRMSEPEAPAFLDAGLPF
jgi:TPR repeat protein